VCLLFRLSLSLIHRQMQGNCGCCLGFRSPRLTDRCRDILGVVQAFPLPDSQTDAGIFWVLFRLSLSQIHRQMQGNCGCCLGFTSLRNTDRCREIVGVVQCSGFPSSRHTDRSREILGVFRLSLSQIHRQMQGNCGC